MEGHFPQDSFRVGSFAFKSLFIRANPYGRALIGSEKKLLEKELSAAVFFLSESQNLISFLVKY